MAAPGEKSFCVLEYHMSKSVVSVQRAFRAKHAKDPPTWPHWPKGTDHCSSEEYQCTHVDVCVARTWILYRCVPCHPWCTHRTSLAVKKNFFSFPVAVNNSIKVGLLVFLLQMFVITENIMKRPVHIWSEIPVFIQAPCPLLEAGWNWIYEGCLKSIRPWIFPRTVVMLGRRHCAQRKETA